MTFSRKNGGTEEVRIDNSVEVYRGDDWYAVVDPQDRPPITTDIQDGGVSRREDPETGEKKYIEFFKEDGGIYVLDHGSKNPTVLEDLGEEVEITPRQKFPIQHDSRIYIGTQNDYVTDSYIKVEIIESTDSWQLLHRQVNMLNDLVKGDGALPPGWTLSQVQKLRDDMYQLQQQKQTTESFQGCLQTLENDVIEEKLQVEVDVIDGNGDDDEISVATRDEMKSVLTRLDGVIERNR